MVNDNYADEDTGFLFSIIYLIRDAQKKGLVHTQQALVESLDAVLLDYKKDIKRSSEFKNIIDLCMGCLNLHKEELEVLLTIMEKDLSRKDGTECNTHH